MPPRFLLTLSNPGGQVDAFNHYVNLMNATNMYLPH